MGTTRLRRHVKNWNQKYTRLPYNSFDHKFTTPSPSFSKLSEGFYGVAKLFAANILTSLNIRGVHQKSSRTVSHATSSANPRVNLSRCSSCSKHTFRGVGNKTLQDFSRAVKTRTVAMWMRGYHTSPRLNSYMPRHFFPYATILIKHLPFLVTRLRAAVLGS